MFGLKFNDPSGNTVADIPAVDRPLTIGRASNVDISLPFKAVSRYHARFFPHGQALFVEDLGSSNGVLVGGLRITGPTQLNPGDEARIGIINVVVVEAIGANVDPYAGAMPAHPYPVEEFEPAPAPAPAPDPAPAYQQPQYPGPDPFGQVQPSLAQPLQQLPPNQYEEPPTRGRPEGMYNPEGQQHVVQPPMQPGVTPEGIPDLGAPQDPDEPSTVQDLTPMRGAQHEQNPEAPTMALPAIPRLVGDSGNMKGEVVYLDQPELPVGRVKGSGLMIEDASVSRNHAKIIRKDEDLFVLYDLRSYNGTFVNDKQITREELTEGDTVRFGDVPFRFLLSREVGVEQKKAMTKRRKRLLVLIGATVVLTLVVIAANILHNPEPPPPPPDPAARERELKSQVRRLLERGNAQLRRKDWESASATLQGVLKLDPLNENAVKGLEKARLERERDGWLAEAIRVTETGRDLSRAQELLNKIPQKSAYYATARVRLRQVNRTIAEESRNKGLSYCRAWRYEECQEHLCKFFQTWPLGEAITDEVRVRRALERAEETLKRRQRKEFVPCKIPEPGTGDQATDAALVGLYPDEKIRRAVVSYYQGHADDSIRLLTTLEKQRRYRDQRETIGKLLQQMIRVQTASADCHRDVRADRLQEAETSFEVMVEADSKVLPAKIKSHYVNEAGKLIGGSYHRIGSNHYRSNRLRESFKAWSTGKRFAPDHVGILQSLLVLNGRASEACEAARSRASSGDASGAASHYELCRDITAQNSELHQQAVKGLRQANP